MCSTDHKGEESFLPWNGDAQGLGELRGRKCHGWPNLKNTFSHLTHKTLNDVSRLRRMHTLNTDVLQLRVDIFWVWHGDNSYGEGFPRCAINK